MLQEQILTCFHNVGVNLPKISDGEDVDIREYIEDSLKFITAIVEIENELNIEIPDEFLIYDKFSSFNSFCDMIASLVKA